VRHKDNPLRGSRGYPGMTEDIKKFAGTRLYMNHGRRAVGLSKGHIKALGWESDDILIWELEGDRLILRRCPDDAMEYLRQSGDWIIVGEGIREALENEEEENNPLSRAYFERNGIL